MTMLLLLLKMPYFCRIITMLSELMLTIAYCSFRWIFRFIQKIISFEMSRHNIDYIIAVYKRIKIYKFTTIAITCEVWAERVHISENCEEYRELVYRHNETGYHR